MQNITKLINLSHSAVQYLIKYFKEENYFKKIYKKRSRLSKLTERYSRYIIRNFFKYPCLSAVKVIAEFNEKLSTSISPETV